MGRRARDTGPRIWVRGFYWHAKGIRNGTHVPAVSMKSICTIADGNRRRRDDGSVEAYEESWPWPLYAPFHAIRLRWNDLQSRRQLTPELADELQVEMYEAASPSWASRGVIVRSVGW